MDLHDFDTNAPNLRSSTTTMSSSLQSAVVDGVEEEATTTGAILFSEDLVKSHETLCDITDRTLDKLLAKDKYLHDIPGDISYEEVLAQVCEIFIIF